MWKAAFTGRTESATGSASGRQTKDESRRKKSSNRAESIISSSSRRDEDKDRERRRKDKRQSLDDNASMISRYENESSYNSVGGSQYATAPSSGVGEPRPLTEKSLRTVPNDGEEEDWEDEDRDTRSEKKTRRKGSESGKRRKSTHGEERDRSLSQSRDQREKKRESRSGKSRAKESVSGRDTELISEGPRAIPEMGSFAQFPGQYGPSPGPQDTMMSGALPSSVPQQQFPGQEQYSQPPPPLGITRADSFGHAADYYLDEGDSVQYQPGVRPLTPNMLTNPDLDHLMAASAVPNPAEDTGHGSAADFYSGKVSPVQFETPQKPNKPGRPSKQSRPSSTGVAAAALAATGIAAMSSSSHNQSSSQQQSTSTPNSSSRPSSKPPRQSSDGSVYYAPPSSNGTYPPTLPSTNGNSGKFSTNSSSIPLYAGAAAVAGSVGYAAYEHSQYSQQSGQQTLNYGIAADGASGGGGQGPPRSPQPGYGYSPPGGSNGDMAQSFHHHEHKGPITRLKDGLLNLISSPEDTAKMEIYTEYIGVCKYCFDPRTSAWDAPRVHHYHKRRDSFEDLRRRRSTDKLRRRGSEESLRRKGSTRVDKDNRYYASESSRRKRESGGTGILGAGLAAAGAAGVASTLFNNGKDFDDTYSVQSGHRESSAVRRRSRSSSQERRRRSTYGVIRPEKEEFVTVRKKDGTIERRKVARKSRSRSRDRKSSSLFGAAATGAALGAAGFAASSGRRSGSRSPSDLAGSDPRARRNERRSSARPEEPQDFFGGFFSPPQQKRRNSREHHKKRRGFFTFSNSSESSHEDLAFGADRPLRPKSSNLSSRAGRNGRRISKKNSDEHLAATVAGIGATAAALAAAQKGHRISKRNSRPELGKRREPRYDTHDANDEEWEDELPSDVDDESSVDGGLAFGEDGNKRLSSRPSMESVGSQSSTGGPLGAWGWRWGGKDQKKRGRRTSPPRDSYPSNGSGSLAAPGLSTAGASVSGAAFDPSRPITKPVYLDDSGRPLPSVSSGPTVTNAPEGPMNFIDPAPLSDAGSRAESRHPSMPGSFEEEPPVIRPGPGPIQQPQPITPIKYRPFQPRRSNSSPTRGHFAQDAALIGAAALGTAGIIAGSALASGSRSREPSNVRFGLTEEQQRKEDRNQTKDRKDVEEERRRADRTRALKEEAERVAKDSRQEEIRQAREDENRRRAEEKLRTQRDAEERAEHQRQIEAARSERQRLEKEAQDRQVAAAAAAAEVERLRLEREEAEREAEKSEQDRRRRETERQRYGADGNEQYTREQEIFDSYQASRDDQRTSGSRWAPVAVGAAAAATVGAVMAAERGADKHHQADTFYDEAHSRPSRDQVYGIEEVKPEHEHEGEPIMDDDIFDPELFKRKHRGSAASEELENDPRYVEFARRAADKIAADRERAYSPQGEDKYTTYADFFMPDVLLNKDVKHGDKVRDVSPHADNEIAVWHSRDDEIRGHFPAYESDYGYGISKHAPHGVPRLNVIAPTPPLESQSPARSSKGSKPSSPLAIVQDMDDDVVEDEQTKSQMSDRPERSRTVSWGEDKTHIYDVATPESQLDRESYITSPDVRGKGDRAAGGVASAAAAGIAGAALHDIIVEEPSGEHRVYSEEDWLRDEQDRKPSRGSDIPDDDENDVEDITPSPDPEPSGQGFYRQPFFDSVSDVGPGLFHIDSPGTEGAPPVRGFIEGEVDEAPAGEKAPHIPGGFDVEDDPVSTDIDKESTTRTSTAPFDDDVAPAWEPPLTKKERKKRDRAAKMSESIAESDPPSPATELPPSSDPARTGAIDSEEYFPPLSKKEKKKMEKEAKKKGVGFSDLVSQLQPKSQVPATSSETPRSEDADAGGSRRTPDKQDREDRESSLKKQGFADIADEVLAAGGIATAATVAAGVSSMAMNNDDGFGGSPNSKKNKKKGSKSKRDSRDFESPTRASYEFDDPNTMPGAWDDERRESPEQSPGEAVDSFQYQVRAPEVALQDQPDPKEVDSWAEWNEPSTGSSKKSKKDKKKAKRGSVAFDSLPDVSSPLRAEVSQDDYIGNGAASGAVHGDVSNGASVHTNGTSIDKVDLDLERSARDDGRSETDQRVSESPRQISPDDEYTGSASERRERRKSKRSEVREDHTSTDELSYAYQTQSIAASEAADDYSRDRRSSKRRSKHGDDLDDTMSVTSNKSRREKDEPSSSTKKESKGGLFGLFGRKSTDDKSSKDETSSDRKISRDDDDGERRRRKRRSQSERSDGESRERHKRSSQSYDDYDRDRSSPSRSEPSSAYRGSTNEDGELLSRKDSHESRGAVSENGQRHYRIRTDEDYDARDQSFLGNRVGEVPPLPADPDKDSEPAAAHERHVQHEQADSGPIAAEPANLTLVEDYTDASRSEDHALQTTEHHSPETPHSATLLETPYRPISAGRPASSTAVPLRFPFGHVTPQTPVSLKERSHSFHFPQTGTGSAGTSPVSPASTTKGSRQNRPHSTEIRPLYLVERNRQTPEVEEALPSLPSSKPSSRASSVHGSDENYHSAAEEQDNVQFSSRRRALTLDTGVAQTSHDDGDMLDSQQTTPKASELPQLQTERHHSKQEPQYYTWDDLAREGHPKEQPQFYTWDDFAQDEKMHEDQVHSGADAEASRGFVQESTPSTVPRSQSSSPAKHDSRNFKGVAAAAMLGTAAIYASHKLSNQSQELGSSNETEEKRRSDANVVQEQVHDYPLPALAQEVSSIREETGEEPWTNTSLKSSDKKKGKKTRRSQQRDTESKTPEALSYEAKPPTEGISLERLDTNSFLDADTQAEAGAANTKTAGGAPEIGRLDTGTFLQEEVDAEEGLSQPQLRSLDGHSEQPRENALDSFLHDENDMEAGVVFASSAAHSRPLHVSLDASRDHSAAQDQGTNTYEELASVASHTLSIPPSAAERSAERSGPEEDSTWASREIIDPGPSDERSVPRQDDEERATASYKIPAAKAEPAPLVIEQHNVVVDHEQPTEIEPVPRLTRKQSKKAKKKQKAAALFSGDIVPEDGEENGSGLNDNYVPELSVETSHEKSDKSNGGKQSVEETRDVSTPVTAIESGPSNDFATSDFALVAHNDSSSWHDTQAQAFSDSMRRTRYLGTDDDATARDGLSFTDVDQSQPSNEAHEPQFDEPARHKKATKDKKKKPPTWSEPDVEETSTAESGLEAAVGIGAAGALGATALEIDEAPFFDTVQSKKQSKKDRKKKQPPSWSDPDAELDATAQDPSVEPNEKSGLDDTMLRAEFRPSEEVPHSPSEAQNDEPPSSGNPSTRQVDEEFASSLTRKQSKKDKKKRKSLAWAEPPDDSEPATEFVSNSRRISVDDTARWGQGPDNERPVEESNDRVGDVETDAAGFEVAVATTRDPALEASKTGDDIDVFSISRKNSKKSKKKAKQAFDWTQTEPEPESQAAELSSSDLPRTGGLDDDAEASARTEDPTRPNEDNILEHPTSVRHRVDETASEEVATREELAAKPDFDEFTPAPSKKKGKKDKKRQTFDWLEPDVTPTTETVDSTFASTGASDVPDVSQPVEQSANRSEDAESQPHHSTQSTDTTGAVAEILQPEEGAAETALEEFAPVSSKKGKKGKKKNQQSFDWTEQDPQALGSSEARDEMDRRPTTMADSREPDTTAQGPEERSEHEQSIAINAAATAAIAVVAADAAAEAFKPTLSRKQSKKEQKKKRQQLLWDLEPEEQQSNVLNTHPTSQDESVIVHGREEDHQSKSEELPSSQQGDDNVWDENQAHAPERSHDSDDPVVDRVEEDSLSRKASKERTQGSVFDDSARNTSTTGGPEASQIEYTQARSDENLETSTDKSPENMQLDETRKEDTDNDSASRAKNIDWDDEIAEEQVAVKPAEQIDSSTPAPESELEPELTWTSTSKRKGKKGKKSRQQSLADTPSADNEVPSEVISRDAEATYIAQTTEPTELEPADPTKDIEDAKGVPAADQPEDDWWSFPANSKGKKKGKKGKSSGTATPISTFAEQAPQSQGVAESDEPVKQVSTDLEPILTSSVLPSATLAEPLTLEDDKKVVNVPEEEFSWASTKKKGKKGRKSKDVSSWNLTPVDDETANSVSADVISTEENAVEQRAEDSEVTRQAPNEDADSARTTGEAAHSIERRPADSTFSDVWAEEEIATTEDHDAVRDLMEEDSKDDFGIVRASSEKGKKKQKKKNRNSSTVASIAGPGLEAAVAGEVADELTPVLDESHEAKEKDEASREVEHPEDTELLQRQDEDHGTLQATVSSGQADRPEAEFRIPQVGKKKGKKSKKSRQQSLFEPETAPDDKNDAEAVRVPEPSASAQAPSNDTWEIPTKGKKGKKAKTFLAWEDDAVPETVGAEDSFAANNTGEDFIVPNASHQNRYQGATEAEQDREFGALASEEHAVDRHPELPSAIAQYLETDVDDLPRNEDNTSSTHNVEESQDMSTATPQPEQVAEPISNETTHGAIARAPESLESQPQDEDLSFTIKKSKKGKKGKKDRSSTTDPWKESGDQDVLEQADPEIEEASKRSSQLQDAAYATSTIDTGVIIKDASNTAPEEDIWPTFSSKQSKKGKKKARQSESFDAALVTPVESLPAPDRDDAADKASEQETNDLGHSRAFSYEGAATEPDTFTGLSEAASDGYERRDIRDHAQTSELERNDTWSPDASTRTPYHESQDLDFTATVAAGLADSGFNPEMVIQDPGFHRRASPPGGVAEADPEEGVAHHTTARKRSKRALGLIDHPVNDPEISAARTVDESLPSDDFNSALTQGLQGTGFDPSLLQQALTSGNEISREADEPEEFSFTTSRRRKNKKENKSHRDEEAGIRSSEMVTGVEGVDVQDHAQASEQRDMDLSQETRAAPLKSAPAEQAEASKAVDILTVGGDEMDMDEMDRAYKAYKKNKRKQKKLKSATRTADTSDHPESTAEETGASAMVSESEDLSRMTTIDDVFKRTSKERASDQMASTRVDTTRTIADQTGPGETITSPTSAVQAAFPGLERVKRRAPPKPEPKEVAPERSPSPPRADPAFGTAGMAAVVAAAARDRQARRESASAREAPRGQPSWSFEALDDHRKQEPEMSAIDSKDFPPVRDSGYQESTQGGDRSSRDIPQILSARSSHESLRKRRSLEPLHIPMSPESQPWEIKAPKKRSSEKERSSSEARSRTPSAETPLRPTSKDRASYLFQSPPEVATGKSPQPMDGALMEYQADNNEYFGTDKSQPRSDPSIASSEITRDRSAFSPSAGPLSPRQALDSIPEEQHAGKRNHAESDVGGPDHVKARRRTGTPENIRLEEHGISSATRPRVTIPSGHARSTSNPLSTDELIKRLSWPSVDEDDDAVHIDRPLGHRYSRPALPDPRSPSVMSNRSNTSGAHFKSPQELRSFSRRDSNASSTHSLRRVNLSGDLRAVSRRGDGSSVSGGARASPITIPFEPPPTPPLNDDDVIDGSASRAADMDDDVFVSHNRNQYAFDQNSYVAQQGYGDAQGSQASPTRPPSVRKRQSMHINELENRVDRLVAENRALQEARSYAEQADHAPRVVNGEALQESLMQRDLQIQEKDAEINKIKAMLQPLQEEIARLHEINNGLTDANRNLVDDTNGRYATLQREHHEAHKNWQSASRELDNMRSEHGRITSGMKDIIEAEIATALADKNAEILRLREQLDIASEQIRALQVQIQSSRSSDFLIQRDEDYFDGSCQKLCQHVQQWVLRFSKLSDNRVCRKSTELKDDKIEARLDNAVLDGSDVDKMLADRVRRRDVFMSVVMTMVWEYVFTRYLFGMDREQRQKLKALEKLLAEVGPPRAVSHWRATTLTLLSHRPTFESQCSMDTEAVSNEIFAVLCRLLPPPSNAEQQLLASLGKVIRIAVDLSIEMRTQRAEYIMLPPLQPEYDTNGDLVRKVHFNSSLMNERSGFFSSNEELAAEQAVVKIVLFPLVVKKGDEVGEGEEEIVVCPAQVLVQNDGSRGKKVVRVMSGAMEIDDPIRGRQSRHSLVSEAPGSVQF